MSTTIDSKVLEMRFDNKQFEAGVAESMSTLDKLKAKLNLTSSAKGLKDVGDAAKNCDMSGLGKGIESVHAKFSALQVIGVTTLANITNSAVNAGKRMVSALTIDPVKTGLQEYETQLNAVQTILANTQKEGTTVKDVNKALDELNQYADLTIYNFTEMTRNIGTFTAAGVKLDTSVNAIQGIANLAAVSGSTSQQASTAMYQLSQALAAGTVKLMDWNSVVNAGMGGQVFQDALRETSRELKTGADEAIKASGSFRESLSSGWLTSKVLTETLKKFTTSGAVEYVAKYTGLTEEAVKTTIDEAKSIDAAAEALAKKSGKNKKEIKDTLQFAKTAEDAATKVKTFTQLWDVLKEAAQSGWSQTWRLVIGDFEEAKALFTPLSEFLTGLIGKMSDARNNLLEDAFGMNFDKLKNNIAKVTEPIEKVVDGADKVGKKVEKVTDSITDLGKVIDDVMDGKFGNGEERFEKLSKAGHNFYRVQNKINESLGNSKRYSKEQIDAQDKLLGKQKESTKETAKADKETRNLTKTQKENIKALATLDDEKLRDKNLTEEQIKALDELRKTAEKLGMPFDEFIDKLDEINGRWLLINSFKNIGQALIKVFGSVGKAFRDVFDAMKPEELFDILAAFHKFTRAMIISDETAEKLRSTFRGLFAVLDIVSRIFSGGLRIGLTILSSILKVFGLTVLDVTATIGDLLYKFDEWLKKNDFIKNFIEGIAEKLTPVVDKVKEFISEAKFDPKQASNLKVISEAFKNIYDVMVGKFNLSLTYGLRILNALLDLFGTTIGDVTAKLAKYLSKAAEWIKSNTFISNAAGKIAEVIKIIITGLEKCARAFMALQPVQDLIKTIKDTFVAFGKAIGTAIDPENFTLLDTLYRALSAMFTLLEKGIKGLANSDAFKAGLNVISGLVKGLTSGIKNVVKTISNIATRLINAFCNLLGIHSPSTVFMAFGGYIVSGLVAGLTSGIKRIAVVVTGIANILINVFCKILGIHSPSTVFMAFGGFIISGLIIGLLQSGGKLKDAITSVFGDFIDSTSTLFKNGVDNIGTFVGSAVTKISEFINDIEWSNLFVIGTVVSTLLLVNKALSITDRVLSGLVDPLFSLGSLLNKLEKAINVGMFKARAEAIKSLAVSIGILAASLYLLSRLSWGDLAKGAVAILVITGALIGLSFAAAKLDSIEIGKLSVFLLSFSASILVLSFAMKKLASIPYEDAKTAIGTLTAMVLLIAILSAVFAGIAAKDDIDKVIKKASDMFIRMSIAMFIISYAISKMAKIPEDDLIRSSVVMSAMVSLLVGIARVSRKAKNANEIGNMLLKMAIAIAIIPFVIKMIAGIPNSDIVKALAVIIAIEGLFAGIIIVAKRSRKNASIVGDMLLKMAGSIMILAFAIKLIASIPTEDVVKGLYVIGLIELLFIAFIEATKKATRAVKIGKIMFAMSLGVLAMSIAIKLIAGMSLTDIAKGVTVIAAFEYMMSCFIESTKKVGKNIDKAGTMLIKASLAILILVGAIALLSILDPKDVIVGTAAISVLMLSLGSVAKAAQKLKNSMTSLIVIAATIALLVGAIVGLTFLAREEQDGFVLATVAIESLILMLAVLMKATSYARKVNKSIFTLVLVLYALSGVFFILKNVPAENAIGSAIAISTVLIALSVAFKILKGIRKPPDPALLGWMLGAVSGIAVILGVLSALDVEPSIEAAMSISALLLAMAGVMAILSLIGTAAGAAIPAALALDAVILIIGALVIGIGALNEKFSNLKEFVNGGIEMLCLLAEGLGKVVTSFVKGFANGAMDILNMVGKNLSTFAKDIQPFISLTKKIDSDVLRGVGILAESIVAITAAKVISGWMSLTSIGTSFANLGSALASFTKNAGPFLEFIGTLNPKTATGAKILGDLILALSEANLADRIANFGLGGQTLAEFGEKLVEFVPLLSTFVDGLGTFTNDQVDTIKCAVSAIKALSDVGSNLDGQTTLSKWLFGDNSIAAFSAQLPFVAKSLKGFVTNLGTFTGDHVVAIKCAGDAIKALAKAGSEVNGQAGWSKALFGDDSLGAFSYQLPFVAKSLKSFVTNLGTFTDDQVLSVKCAGNAIKALVNAGSNIDGQAGWAKALFGDNGLGAFSADLPAVARNIKDFVSNLGTFGKGQIATVSSAVGVVNALAKLGNSDLGTLNATLPGIGEKLKGFADDLVSFCNKMKTLDGDQVADISRNLTSTVANLADKIEKSSSSFKSAGSDISKSLRSGISKNKSSVINAGTNTVNELKNKLLGKQDDFEMVGKKLGAGLISGLKSKNDGVKKSGESLAAKAKSGANSKSVKSDFVSAGKNLGQGLINGLNAKKQLAYDKGYEVGKAAARGVKDGADENSPSKLTYQYGKWIGDGLILGIASKTKSVYNAGREMGETSVKAVSKTISKLSSFVDSGVDVNPTIRPVLDLSNIKSGAGAINGMLGQTVAVGANLSAINYGMNQRSRIGANADLISAIDDLRKDLSASGGDSYQINGITYDDGSNVADAIKTIVRAAKVERRK